MASLLLNTLFLCSNNRLCVSACMLTCTQPVSAMFYRCCISANCYTDESKCRKKKKKQLGNANYCRSPRPCLTGTVEQRIQNKDLVVCLHSYGCFHSSRRSFDAVLWKNYTVLIASDLMMYLMAYRNICDLAIYALLTTVVCFPLIWIKSKYRFAVDNA